MGDLARVLWLVLRVVHSIEMIDEQWEARAKRAEAELAEANEMLGAFSTFHENNWRDSLATLQRAEVATLARIERLETRIKELTRAVSLAYWRPTRPVNGHVWTKIVRKAFGGEHPPKVNNEE